MADDVQLRAIDPFYKIRFDDGTVIHYSADLDATRAEIAHRAARRRRLRALHARAARSTASRSGTRRQAVPRASQDAAARSAPD
jgi:hypothetical protein